MVQRIGVDHLDRRGDCSALRRATPTQPGARQHQQRRSRLPGASANSASPRRRADSSPGGRLSSASMSESVSSPSPPPPRRRGGVAPKAFSQWLPAPRSIRFAGSTVTGASGAMTIAVDALRASFSFFSQCRFNCAPRS